MDPRLVCVTKTKPPADIIAAYGTGERHFGENYVSTCHILNHNMWPTLDTFILANKMFHTLRLIRQISYFYSS